MCRRGTIIIDIYTLLSVLTYQKHSFVKIEDNSLDFNALVIDMYIMCSLVASGGKKTVGCGVKPGCVACIFFFFFH